MLTARGAVPERVAGLEAGADDYLVKPFALEELVARVNAILRRREPEPTTGWSSATSCSTRSSSGSGSAGAETALSRREFAMLTDADGERRPGGLAQPPLRRGLGGRGRHPQQRDRRAHVAAAVPRLEASAQVKVTTLRGTGYRLETSPR